MSRVVKLDEGEMYHSETSWRKKFIFRRYAKMGLNEWRVNHG